MAPDLFAVCLTRLHFANSSGQDLYLNLSVEASK